MGIFILYILWHIFCPPPSSGMSQICGFWWITAETSPSLERSVASWTGQTGCKALRCRCGIASSTQHGIFSSSQWWIVPHVLSVWGQSQAMLPRCRCSSFWHSACFGRVLVCQFHKENDLWQSCTAHFGHRTGPSKLDLAKQGGHTWNIGPAEDFSARNSVLSTDPRYFLCQLRWRWLHFLAWCWQTTRVSHSYRRLGIMAAWQTFSLISCLMPLLDHTDSLTTLYVWKLQWPRSSRWAGQSMWWAQLMFYQD